MRSLRSVLRRAAVFVLSMMLLGGTGTAAKAKKNTSAPEVFYEALMKTLESGSFAYEITMSPSAFEYVFADDTDMSELYLKLYNRYVGDATLLLGNVEFDEAARSMALQVSMGRVNGWREAYYLSYHNGSYTLCDYDDSEWEEGFEPMLSGLFKVLRGDGAALQKLLAYYDEDLIEMLDPSDQVPKLLTVLLETLTSKKAQKGALSFEEDDGVYRLHPDLAALAELLFDAAEPCLNSWYFSRSEQDLKTELLEYCKTYLPSPEELELSFTVEDEQLTSLSLAVNYVPEEDVYEVSSGVEAVLDPKTNEVEITYSGTDEQSERSIRVPASFKLFELTLSDIGSSPITPPMYRGA